MTIPTLPAGPQPTDSLTDFNTKSFNFVAAMNPWGVAVQAVGDAADASASAAAASALTATNQAVLAATQATNAAVSAAQSAESASTNGVLWQSGVTYTGGTLQYDPTNYRTYRRKTTGSGAVQPKDSPDYASVFPLYGLGAVHLLSPALTANEYLHPNGSKYLKTGVLVNREDALTAGYDVTTLEGMGWARPASFPAQVPTGYMVAFGGGKFVAVGDTGLVKYSTDGVNWSTATSGTSSNLTFVTYVNGRFVATSNTALIHSTDGITWTAGTLGLGVSFVNLDYIGGVYCTNKASYGFYWSTDLTTWYSSNNTFYGWQAGASGKFISAQGSGGVGLFDSTTKTFRLAYGSSSSLTGSYANGKYFAFSTSGTLSMAYSSDGVNWTAGTAPPNHGGSLQSGLPTTAFGASMYVKTTSSVLNTIMSSPDGITWTNRTTAGPSYPQGCTFLVDKFFAYVGALGSGTGMSYSTNGTSWSACTGLGGASSITKVVYGAGVYVAVGGNNTTAAYIDSSTDGITWTSRSATADCGGYKDCIVASGLFVAIGDSGVIRTSGDGITWTLRTCPLGAVPLERVYSANGVFFITTGGTFIWSTNGTSWNSGPSYTMQGSVSSAANISWTGTEYCFLCGPYPSVGFTTSYTGTIPIRVGPQSSTAASGKGGNSGTLVVYGGNGGTSSDSFFSTVDGKVYSGVAKPTTLSTSTSVYRIAYVNSSFVAIRGDNIIDVSSTGLDWSGSAQTLSSLTNGRDIAYNAGTYYIVGTAGSYTSTNLSSWTLRTSPYFMTSLAVGNGYFIGLQFSTGGVVKTPDGVVGAIGASAAVSVSNVSSYLQVA